MAVQLLGVSQLFFQVTLLYLLPLISSPAPFSLAETVLLFPGPHANIHNLCEKLSSGDASRMLSWAEIPLFKKILLL